MVTENGDKVLIRRLDIAIDKLTEVAGDIKAVLAVHEAKFDNQENVNATYYDQIEKLHARIGDLRDETIANRKELKVYWDKKFNDIDVKLAAIEKWRWVIIGAALFAGFMFSSTNVIEVLTSLNK